MQTMLAADVLALVPAEVWDEIRSMPGVHQPGGALLFLWGLCSLGAFIWGGVVLLSVVLSVGALAFLLFFSDV